MCACVPIQCVFLFGTHVRRKSEAEACASCSASSASNPTLAAPSEAALPAASCEINCSRSPTMLANAVAICALFPDSNLRWRGTRRTVPCMIVHTHVCACDSTECAQARQQCCNVPRIRREGGRGGGKERGVGGKGGGARQPQVTSGTSSLQTGNDGDAKDGQSRAERLTAKLRRG